MQPYCKPPRPIESPCDIHVSSRFLILRTPLSRWVASGCLVHLECMLGAHRSRLPLECGAGINGLLQVMLVMPCRPMRVNVVQLDDEPLQIQPYRAQGYPRKQMVQQKRGVPVLL